MSNEMTYEQMLAQARAIFPDAAVEGSKGTWTIKTGVRILDEVSKDWKDTPAHEAYLEDDTGYGSSLERWGVKNGFADTSLYEIAHAYNKVMEGYQSAYDDFTNFLKQNDPIDAVLRYINGEDQPEEEIATAKKLLKHYKEEGGKLEW